MKRFISAIAFSASLLVLLSLFLFPPVKAKENVVIRLLNLPAPPPPNPLVSGTRIHDDKFYDKNNPPDDNAPIEDLIDYWTHQAGDYRGALYYSPRPSERTLERLAREMAKKPEMATQLLNVMPESKAAIDAVKELYDKSAENGADKNQRQQLRNWLRFHSPYFSGDLVRSSQQIKDVDDYVDMTREANLLALTRHDFDKASPVINQLYNDSTQPVSKALATWALYRRALETNSLGDVERYRSELMRMVEDRSLSDGVRDMANDALTREPDFPGRDEWTLSLFEDETLVNMPRFSMLTTLVMYSSPDKYVPKMIALIEKTSNPTVRAAAVHNLAIVLGRDPDPEMQRQIIQSMLPWLDDPKWASDSGWLRDSRETLVRKLSEYEIPESVPGLLKILDEKRVESGPKYGPAANAMPANVRRMIEDNTVPAANANVAKGSTAKDGPPVISYPYRYEAVNALAKQKDGRAAPALRRVLLEAEGYERQQVVKAILACGGFSIPEQLDALEGAIKRSRDAMNAAGAANTVYPYGYVPPTNMFPAFTRANTLAPVTPAEITYFLGQQLTQSGEISDALAAAVVDRVKALDEKDPKLAEAYRSVILRWDNAVFNVLLLHDLKRDAADINTIVRLLGQRKELREKFGSDVFDLQGGTPVAVGVSACLLEDAAGFDAILGNADVETKTAMLACARLIRAALPVAKVGESLKSPSQILQTAAERYLEAEDSSEAQALVLARHQNEAKILGATSAFYVEDAAREFSEYLWLLYLSLGDNALYNGWNGSGNDDELKNIEKRLQAEVKKDDDLVGVYAYDRNYIRIYKDRIMFSWDEDDPRYRERPLTKYEFDEIKAYLATNKVDTLPPFLSCGGGYCMARELVMLGRNGGRRIYTNSGGPGIAARSNSDFFAGLDKYFADLKLTKATLKYNLSREIPGLEIILASDDLHAETVWKDGTDLRVAASEAAVRKKIDAETDDAEPGGDSEQDTEDDVSEETERTRTAFIEKHRYDGYAWYKVAGGEIAGNAVQPPQIEFIPLRDTLAVQPGDEQWKARAGEIEIRISGEGIFKIVRGKLTNIRKGNYQNAVITPNGRWGIVVKFDPENGEAIVRIDLVTGREYPLTIPGYGQHPSAYIATLNKFLVIPYDRYDYDVGYFQEEDETPDDDDPSGMILVDPATGATQPIAGEFRPLSQQTFRGLQQTSNPDEFWAAIYDPKKNETQVGRYDTKLFGFKPVLSIPKIKFNSMSMWVDETGGKVYFVYRGHLLALPLQKQVVAASTK